MTTATSTFPRAFAVLSLLAGCLYPPRAGGGGFDQLAGAEQGMFRRCQRPLAEHLCAGADEAAQARCLRVQALTYARRSDKMRRRWLELNQCPSSVIDGPDQPVAIAETPPPKAEEAPKAADAPKAAEAAAPAVVLLAAGAACHRSAECESDLCVRGACVALAMIEIGKAVQAPAPTPREPAPAVAVAEPVPAEPGDESAEPEPEPDPTPAAAPPEAAKKSAEPAAAALDRLPTGPRLASAAAASDQLRGAIVQHEAEMKRCVERQLKLVPDLRAEGTLVLEVSASGRVTQAALRGERLHGTPLEICMRTIAARWVFPRTSRAYAVEAPLKVSGVEERRP